MRGNPDRRPGEAVLLRSVFDDHVGAVMPCVVVQDSAECVALYQPPGTSMLIRSGRRGGPRGRNMFPGGWDGGHDEVEWTGAGVLRVHRPGEPWSIWRWLDGDGWRPGYYINLELPWVPVPTGYDTRDWILDLVVDGAGSIDIKDDDELSWVTEVGVVSEAHADRVRRAAEQATGVLRQGGWPFQENWDRWLPDPGWTVPSLSDQDRDVLLGH